MANRRPPMASTGNATGEDNASGYAFGLFSSLADVMDFGLSDKPGPSDLLMVEAGAQSLK